MMCWSRGTIWKGASPKELDLMNRELRREVPRRPVHVVSEVVDSRPTFLSCTEGGRMCADTGAVRPKLLCFCFFCSCCVSSVLCWSTQALLDLFRHAQHSLPVCPLDRCGKWDSLAVQKNLSFILNEASMVPRHFENVFL